MTECMMMLGLLSRIVVVFLMLSLLSDLVQAAELNGPVVKALREVWTASILLVCWMTLGVLESYIDFIPDVNLRYELAERWVWVPYTAWAIAAGRMWWALHTYRRQEGK